MAVTESKMWELVHFCNGQIRIKAGRYGGGWLAAGCAVIEWDFDSQWDDMTCGDMDYFSARAFFNAQKDVVLIEHAESARAAFDACVARLAASITAVS